MDFFSVLTLIGGLALFLYGMDVMGDGLKKISGSKLELILSKLTANRLKGFLLGFLVTAVIQSSSATTVMLVGFVNSGIMNLGQTMSTIMGANVGTTVTAWLLSLSGISGESFILRILKPTSFTPILAAVGIFLHMMAKSDKKKYVGSILLGFAVLMFGMDTMSGAVSGLKDSPEFAKILIMFQNPVMGILAGTILTAILQSSSASVGILQALALTGTISFGTAFPIILGQNIGTTITPILSSINGNTDAKRVAFSCLYIKLLGVLVVVIPFYLITGIVDFAFTNAVMTPATIAIIHTLFNVVSTIVLIPFCNQIEHLARATIRTKAGERATDVFDTLDERFLSVPGFAVEKCRELVYQMAEITKKSIADSVKLLEKYDEAIEKDVQESEDTVDLYEDKISTYLVHLAGKDLSDNESREVTKLLHVIGDVERISDHAVNLARAAKEIYEKGMTFSENAQREIKTITSAVCEILSITTEALINDDIELAKRVEPLEQIIDRLRGKIKAGHIRRLQEGRCTVEQGFVLSDLLHDCERVSDHCSNIAVCILEIANNSFETHEYLSHVKNDGENEFFERYAEYKEKYKI